MQMQRSKQHHYILWALTCHELTSVFLQQELASLKGLSIPLRIRGTFTEPDFKIELDEVLFDRAFVEGNRDEVELVIDSKRIPMLIEQMPERHREVIVMRYLDGLMPAEIADILKEPVNTISVRINRGMTWLSKNADSPIPYKKMKQGHVSKYDRGQQ